MAMGREKGGRTRIRAGEGRKQDRWGRRKGERWGRKQL